MNFNFPDILPILLHFTYLEIISQIRELVIREFWGGKSSQITTAFNPKNNPMALRC